MQPLLIKPRRRFDGGATCSDLKENRLSGVVCTLWSLRELVLRALGLFGGWAGLQTIRVGLWEAEVKPMNQYSTATTRNRNPTFGP